MFEFQKATRLSEVAAAVDLQPLESGDPRYVDVSAGRGTNPLKRLRLTLEGCDAEQNRFAKIAFSGHRGCGKSTELLRLEHEVAARYTSLHVTAEEALLGDYNYTDLFLWLVDELVRKFEADDMPLSPALANDVASWFAEVTRETVATTAKEIELDAEATAGGKAGLFGLSLGLLARLKSIVKGSVEHRKVIRQKLQDHSTELIRRVNLLLDDAHRALGDHGRPANLLIVVDNLDRLAPRVGESLFFQNGDLLKTPRAHVIYTVPIATVLAPLKIGTVFERCFTLPMVKVRTREDRPSRPGIDALMKVVGERIDVDAVFQSRKVVRRLAEMSGGSVRDLMRLVGNAQLEALVDEKETIDMASATRAVMTLRQEFERLLIPARVYYPRLTQIHATKGDGCDPVAGAGLERAEEDRTFFSQFLFNGSVLEYNGGETWYDVHPIIRDIRAFREAMNDAEGQGEASQSR